MNITQEKELFKGVGAGALLVKKQILQEELSRHVE